MGLPRRTWLSLQVRRPSSKSSLQRQRPTLQTMRPGSASSRRGRESKVDIPETRSSSTAAVCTPLVALVTGLADELDVEFDGAVVGDLEKLSSSNVSRTDIA